jgi:hypothetical protein
MFTADQILLQIQMRCKNRTAQNHKLLNVFSLLQSHVEVDYNNSIVAFRADVKGNL